jgi:hypothetical protein
MEQVMQNLYTVVTVLEMENAKLQSELQQARESRISALEKLQVIADRDARIAELEAKLVAKQVQVNRKDKTLFNVRKQLKESLEKLAQAK